MDAQPEGDFETADSAPKPKAKAAPRRASVAQPEPKPDESEQIETPAESQAERQEQTPVELYANAAPIYRERRITKLARRNRDVLWLVQEVERLKKELEAK